MNLQNKENGTDKKNVGTEETSFKLSPLLSESEMDSLQKSTSIQDISDKTVNKAKQKYF